MASDKKTTTQKKMISVDSGMIWVGDPCYTMGPEAQFGIKDWQRFCDKIYGDGSGRVHGISTPLGRGVGCAISSGYGDGEYPVEIERVDGRVRSVKITFIGQYD